MTKHRPRDASEDSSDGSITAALRAAASLGKTSVPKTAEECTGLWSKLADQPVHSAAGLKKMRRGAVGKVEVNGSSESLAG